MAFVVPLDPREVLVLGCVAEESPATSRAQPGAAVAEEPPADPLSAPPRRSSITQWFSKVQFAFKDVPCSSPLLSINFSYHWDCDQAGSQDVLKRFPGPRSAASDMAATTSDNLDTRAGGATVGRRPCGRCDGIRRTRRRADPAFCCAGSARPTVGVSASDLTDFVRRLANRTTTGCRRQNGDRVPQEDRRPERQAGRPTNLKARRPPGSGLLPSDGYSSRQEPGMTHRDRHRSQGHASLIASSVYISGSRSGR